MDAAEMGMRSELALDDDASFIDVAAAALICDGQEVAVALICDGQEVAAALICDGQQVEELASSVDAGCELLLHGESSSPTYAAGTGPIGIEKPMSTHCLFCALFPRNSRDQPD